MRSTHGRRYREKSMARRSLSKIPLCGSKPFGFGTTGRHRRRRTHWLRKRCSSGIAATINATSSRPAHVCLPASCLGIQIRPEVFISKEQKNMQAKSATTRLQSPTQVETGQTKLSLPPWDPPPLPPHSSSASRA